VPWVLIIPSFPPIVVRVISLENLPWDVILTTSVPHARYRSGSPPRANGLEQPGHHVNDLQAPPTPTTSTTRDGMVGLPLNQ